MSILSFYTSSLRTHPKLTNSLSTGFLFGSGDIIAQFIQPDKKVNYDPKRTIRAIIYGSLIFSFIGDKWYKILSKLKFPGKPLQNPKLNNFRNGLTKMTIDQLGFAPIGIPIYYTVMSILENKDINGIQSKLQNNWLDTLKVNWMIWPVFQIFNLTLIPVQHQLLSVNILSIFWNTYLSMRNARKGHEIVPVHSPPVPE